MPGYDLSGYGNLSRSMIEDLLKGYGVEYPERMSQGANYPQRPAQYLPRQAPQAIPQSGVGFRGLLTGAARFASPYAAMLAPLLSLGGDTSPDVEEFYRRRGQR